MTDPFITIQELIKANQHQEALELIQIQDWPIHLHIQKHSWSAQALFQQHRTKEALDEIIVAIRLAKKDGNEIAYRELKKLQSQIVSVDIAKKALQDKAKTSTPITEALQLFSSQPNEAIQKLQQIKSQADEQHNTKDRVLTRLALAQSMVLRQFMLEEAQQIADEAGDHNLITAVKKTFFAIQYSN